MKKVAVFVGDHVPGKQGAREGYHTFRIPALVQTRSGDLLAFCEGRRDSAQDFGKIDLVMKRSTDGGKTWSKLQVIYGEAGETTIGNPVPIVDRTTGTIHLICCRNNREGVLYTRSTDHGHTWQTPRLLTDANGGPNTAGLLTLPAYAGTLTALFGVEVQRFGTGPGHGVQLPDGRLLVPIWFQGSNARPYPGPQYNTDRLAQDGLAPAHVRDPHLRYFAGVLYSDDQGQTWHAGGLCTDWINESALAVLPDGALLINARGNRGYYRVTARSMDRGKTFTDAKLDRNLVENQCQGSLVTLTGPDGRSYLLFSNPAVKGPGNLPRTHVTLRMSADGGATWPFARTIDAGFSAYSDLCPLPDGAIGILYERGEQAYYETIAFMRVTLEWLQTGSLP